MEYLFDLLISLLFSHSCSILRDSVRLLNNFVLCSSPFFSNYFVFIVVIMKRSLRICLHIDVKSDLRNCQYRRYYQVVAYRRCLCNWVAASEHQFVFRSISLFHCNGFFFELPVRPFTSPLFSQCSVAEFGRDSTRFHVTNKLIVSIEVSNRIAEKYSIMER